MNEGNLGRKLEQTNEKAQYDSCAKRLLGEKVVLAMILKYATTEFANYSVEEIRNRYIESVEIETRGVDMDETNVEFASWNEGSEIAGENVESVTLTEGKVVFDVLFRATAPAERIAIQLILNVEAQKADPSQYELVTRGEYYCGRMISSQKGSIFENSDYQKLRKVYSIWICMNPKANRRNTMNAYTIEEHNLVGAYKADRRSYDLMNVIVINLGGKGESEEPLLKFLEVLLSNERAPEEKRKVLLEDYGIETTGSMEKEMSDMCNLSQGIEDRGIALGKELGKEQGIALGKEEGIALGKALGKEQGLALGKEEQARDSAIQMYQDNVPVEKIALYTGYAVETIKQWITQ